MMVIHKIRLPLFKQSCFCRLAVSLQTVETGPLTFTLRRRGGTEKAARDAVYENCEDFVLRVRLSLQLFHIFPTLVLL